MLPFVELGDDGLVLHDTVREAIAAQLRSADPDRSRRYRAAAWRQLREEVARASSQEMWRYTADLLYILQNPAVREAFFPTTEHLFSVEIGHGRTIVRPSPRSPRATSRTPRSRSSTRGGGWHPVPSTSRATGSARWPASASTARWTA